MSPRKLKTPACVPAIAISRRHFLASTVSVGSVSLAGCSRVVEFVGGLAMEDVTIVNGSPNSLTGTVVVHGPTGDVLLDERFAVGAQASRSDDEDETAAEADESTVTLYQGVLTENGEYTVAVEVDTSVPFADEKTAEKKLTVSNIEEEYIVIFLDPSKQPAPIAIDTVKSFSELDRFDEEYGT